MSKRLSEKQKDQISNFFINGNTIDELSKRFNCTKLTISRNLIKKLGDKKYKELVFITKSSKKFHKNKDKINLIKEENQLEKDNQLKKKNKVDNINESKIYDDMKEDNFTSMDSFMEIVPLDYEIENTNQKDLSSIPISEIDLPKTVFMIVDKKIELETKLLGDYAEWQFLSKNELNRRTIQIFKELKHAKRFCSKDQKVIKVPNADVFRIVAPLLVSRGISRIISDDKLIAL